MAYKELIKNFETVRDYMREFYVYGFRTREEIGKYSARAYDNERRRVSSWLKDYMFFTQDGKEKNVFISVDSRDICHNPLYNAFKTTSFTPKDIMLHFFILDLLQDGDEMNANQIIMEIGDEYLNFFDDPLEIEDSIIRYKLKEYAELGILNVRRNGRELLYSRATDPEDMESWADALNFYSETDPMGVIGSYILDQKKENSSRFHFRHHFILHALDSQILEQLLEAIQDRKTVTVTMIPNKTGEEIQYKVTPVKILVSTQTGRQYLLAYSYKIQKPVILRLNFIHAVEPGNTDRMFGAHSEIAESCLKHLWGVSLGKLGQEELEHIEMTVRAEPEETYIVQRLEREKRCGTVEKIGDTAYKFTADVYDAGELMPWIRTFIGRIDNLTCSNPEITERFKETLREMQNIYGGDSNGIQ